MSEDWAARPLPPEDQLTAAEAAVDAWLVEANQLPGDQIRALVSRHAELLGVGPAIIYLVDLQQDVLVPFPAAGGPEFDETIVSLNVDGAVGGRAYQRSEVVTQNLRSGVRMWLPLVSGGDRLGVLSVIISSEKASTGSAVALHARLRRLAALTADLVMTKTLYCDTLVSLRRRAAMGLAAELQWSLLPPLTYCCHGIAVAGALEPAYQVAGDTVDYAVDKGYARVAVFDGMGHGLQSAQLAALTVSANRNARRGGRDLTETARFIDASLFDGFAGEGFATAVLAELQLDTGRLEWVNAGHPEPLLLRGGRLVKTLHADPAPPLGLGRLLHGETPIPFAVGAEHLQAGDRVLFYTDGVTDARSPDGDFFGLQRLVDLLNRNLADGLPAPENMRRIVHALLSHQQAQLTDDATLLLVQWRDEDTVAPAW